MSTITFGKAYSAPQAANPTSIKVKLSPTNGHVIEWNRTSWSPTNFIKLEKKTSNSSWERVSGAQVSYSDGNVVVRALSVPTISGLQYRVKICSFAAGFKTSCNKGWSPASQAINVSSYNRDTSDENSNGIRDDVETIADLYHARGSDNHIYLLH